MSFGITETGFTRKTLQDVIDELNQAWRDAFGAQIDTAAESPLGQLTGTFAAPIAEAWELLEECYHSANPDAATGFSLISLCALSGTTQKEATGTVVLATVNLNAGALLPVGTLAAIDGREDLQFALAEEVENTGGSAASFTGTRWVCTQTGPIACNAGTLTIKVSGISGWNSITNPADGVRGRDIEGWIDLRERREAELAQRGGSTVRAIEADVLKVGGVETCRVYENTTDAEDVNGLPPKSFEALIDDGAIPAADNDEVAAAVWNSKPAGIRAYGTTSGSVTDAAGTRNVYFSRVTRLRVYLRLRLTTTSKYPIDGNDQVKEAILAAAKSHFGVGDTVTALVLQSAPLSVSGVSDVPEFYMDFAPTPAVSAPLPVGVRARATFDSGDIEFI